MNFVTTVSDVVRRSNGIVRSLPLDLWPEADRNAWVAACQPAARLKRGGAAPAISRPSRARPTSGITGIFLDASIAMGCSDEMNRLRLT